jgi:hypothetical protein
MILHFSTRVPLAAGQNPRENVLKKLEKSAGEQLVA